MILATIILGTIAALLFAAFITGPLKRHNDNHDPFA